MVAKNRLNPFGDSSKNFPFFPSLCHKKGVHRIVRGLESSCGLILLTGKIGVGKTSLSRYIQEYLTERFAFVELGNPYQTPLEQIFHCCEKMGIPAEGLSTIHDCVEKLEKRFKELVAQGKRPVIVFEESHLLTKRHLGLIHILSNLRVQDGPLVQILLVGQLEILDLLDTEGMEALNQRIGVRCRLASLNRDDTERYICFKMETGGLEGVSFSRRAVDHVWRQSGGVPRLVNHICAHSLDALAFKGTSVVSAGLVDEVCRDSVYSGLFHSSRQKETLLPRMRGWITAVGLAVVTVCAVLTWSAPEGFIERAATAGVRLKVAPFPEDETASAAVMEAPVAMDAADQNDVVLTVDEPDPAPEADASGKREPREGDAHPEVGKFVLGAIAWNADPAKSIAVVDSKLVHAGEQAGNARIVEIGKDFVVLEFEGELYKRSISR